MADLGHFAQFARTLLFGHFWSRRLRQKIARLFHIKRILMSREDHLRRAVFQAPKLGLLLSHFPLVPLCRISENGRFRSVCPICQNSAFGSKSVRKAEFWQIGQSDLNRPFSEILQRGDQGKIAQK